MVKHAPNSTLVSTCEGVLTFKVPQTHGDSDAPAKEDNLIGLFSALEAQKAAIGIEDFSVGLATLEEVVDFYRRGGGRALGVPAARIDGQIRAFSISDAEAADLVAFLCALTDESASPPVPDRVPSGLPTVGETTR